MAVVRLAAEVVLLVLILVHAARAEEIGPETNWCQALDALAPGDELVLRPGDYRDPCTIGRGGIPAAPLLIRAKDPRNPPRLLYPGKETNVVNIRADHVTLRGLQIGPTQPNVDGVRIYLGSGITIEDCRFVEVGGIAVVANHSNASRITVRRNEISRSRATAMYFGCHDGISCVVSELLIEQNFIHGVDAPASYIGYGVQVKLNSTGTIRDNVIADTKGPGIMVYGSTGLLGGSLVERNFVVGSRTSSAIVVGGGPAIVRNNVAIASAEAGIGLEDYARRGLLRGIVVVHNTVYGNGKGGILLPSQGRMEVTVVNNAVHVRSGTPPYPRGGAGVLSSGNLDCSWLPCFAAPEAQDFSPVPGSPLVRLGRLHGDAWMPADDYFGLARGLPPTVGAVEQPAAPISLGIKALPK